MTTIDWLRDVKIEQNKNGYRFSVDALLLFSFVTRPHVKKIADLGAGAGIVGLLLARKYSRAEVTLIELQESLARLAESNIVLNGLEDRVKVIKADVKEIRRDGFGPAAGSFDVVVCNPPFRKPRTGLISPANEKAIARHEIMMPLDDLMKASSFMLKHHGRLCIIHLPERLAEIMRAMQDHALEPKRMQCIHSFTSSEAAMVLIEAAKGAKSGMKVEKPLIIYKDDGSYTEEMVRQYSV